MANIDRIQAQLRSSAASVFEVESTPPFTCYFNPDDPAPHANCAMPDTNVVRRSDRGAGSTDRLLRTPWATSPFRVSGIIRAVIGGGSGAPWV